MRVFLITPCYRHNTHVEYTRSLVGTLSELPKTGIENLWHQFVIGLPIAEARNEATALFLASDATDLVMIDDDIGWKPSDLWRLLSHPLDLVGAICRLKTQELKLNFEALDGAAPPSNGLSEVKRIGTGMIRISRRVIETLIQANPHLRYRNNKGRERHALFNFAYREVIIGEDFGFCDLWRERGGRVWCDIEAAVTHWEGSVPFRVKITTGNQAGQ